MSEPFLKATVILHKPVCIVTLKILNQRGFLRESFYGTEFVFRCGNHPELQPTTIYLLGEDTRRKSAQRLFPELAEAELYANNLVKNLRFLNAWIATHPDLIRQ